MIAFEKSFFTKSVVNMYFSQTLGKINLLIIIAEIPRSLLIEDEEFLHINIK